MKNVLLMVIVAIVIVGCNSDDATIAKHNMAKAADNFQIDRRIVFYNTWTDTVIQQVEGKCSIDYDNRVSLICKVGPDQYKRSFISLSGQVTVFVEQMKSIGVNVYHYRRTFKPQGIISDVDFRGSSAALKSALTPDNND